MKRTPNEFGDEVDVAQGILLIAAILGLLLLAIMRLAGLWL